MMEDYFKYSSLIPKDKKKVIERLPFFYISNSLTISGFIFKIISVTPSVQ